MTKHKITVTQDDIDEGCALSANNCPIARALVREFYNPDVWVGSSVRIRYPSGGSRRYEISRAARRFINRFDEGKEVKPFSFIITETVGYF